MLSQRSHRYLQALGPGVQGRRTVHRVAAALFPAGRRRNRGDGGDRKSLGSKSQVSIAEAASSSSAGRVCDELYAAARDWPTEGDLSLRHIETAHRFANAIQSANPIECFTALLQHHEIYGGGLRWFVLRGGQVEPRLPPLTNASGYRFRLWSLCRLATQCGVIRDMPAGLREEDEELAEEA